MSSDDPRLIGENPGHRVGVDGELAKQISARMTALLKRHFGKGPTQAKTYIGDEIITCILRGTMSPADKVLVIAGKGEQVHETKQLLQGAMRHEMIHAIEELVDRPVISYLSDHDVARDIASEVFVLGEPEAPSQ
jgi:uncharacterized protein YbcI